MCLVSQPKASTTPIMQPPELPPEPQAAKAPDGGTVSSAARRVTDRLRAGASTILTSGQGVTTTAPTAGKTLLGQ
jgi:hypothetical protein